MNKNKNLIISADDYGLTKGISLGIIDALEAKGISDTNFLANAAYSLESLALAKKKGLLAMGIHLNLNIGTSCYYKREISYLNEFIGTNKYYQMIENEFFEQTEFLIQHGIQLTHLTYHKNIINTIEIAEIVKKLAQQYNVPVRRLSDPAFNQLLTDAAIKMPDRKIINSQGTEYSKQLLVQLLSAVKENESAEVICHPGYVTEELTEISSMVERREAELELFTRSEIKCMIKEMGFKLINYINLKG